MLDKIMEFVKNNVVLVGVTVGAFVLVVLILIIAFIRTKKKENKKEEIEHQDLTNNFEVEKKSDELIEEQIKEEIVEEKTEEVLVEEKVIEENNEEIVINEDVVEEETDNVVVDEEILEEEKTEEVVVDEEVTEEQTEELGQVKTQRVVKGKYEIASDGTGYQFILKASNGEVLIESEYYESKDAVISAIEKVKKNLETGTIKIAQDKRNLFRFSLVAKNHRTLLTSANYNTEKDCIRASNSFKRFAVVSPIIEVEGISNNRELIEKVEITPKKGGKIFILGEEPECAFQLKANNGEILCTSSSYKTKNGCLGGLETFKSAIRDGKFYVYKDKRGYYQFKLYSASNRLVMVGETYASRNQAVSSISSVRSFIDEAEIK